MADVWDQYADDVLSGRVVAGKWTKLACQRHLDDLEHGRGRGLRFDAGAARRLIAFFGMLSHSKGEWAGEAVAKPVPAARASSPIALAVRCVMVRIVQSFRSVPTTAVGLVDHAVGTEGVSGSEGGDPRPSDDVRPRWTGWQHALSDPSDPGSVGI